MCYRQLCIGLGLTSSLNDHTQVPKSSSFNSVWLNNKKDGSYYLTDSYCCSVLFVQENNGRVLPVLQDSSTLEGTGSLEIEKCECTKWGANRVELGA